MAPDLVIRLGNDVVDRAHPRIVAPRDRSRLVERILSPAERAWVRHGESGWPLRLWSTWAAKESGFKIACKWPGPRPVFRHADFRTELRLRSSGEGLFDIEGTVCIPPDDRVRLTGWATPSVIHLAGAGAPSASGSPRPRLELGAERIVDPDEPLDALRPHFTDLEWEGIHGLPSARARLLARARLAAHLTVDEDRIQILTSARRPGRTPPRVLMDGAELRGVDLSISHHGRYVAWALLLPSDPPSAAPQNPGR